MDTTARREYWRRNLRLKAGLLAVWFVVSYGFGILLVDQLNEIGLGDFQLGFWFAQQGSIFVFVALIGIYAWRMDILDNGLEADEGGDGSGEGPAGGSGDGPGDGPGETGAAATPPAEAVGADTEDGS